MSTVIIRLSSLGDIVLSAAITQALAPVTYITSAPYKELVRQFPGVDAVCVPAEDPLPKSAHRIIDLHANWRSFWIRQNIKGPTRRIQRHDILRRTRVWFKNDEVPPSVLQRYATAAKVQPSALPWLSRSRSGETLLMCPTAKHATKQWPKEKFIALAQAWKGPVTLLGGPTDLPLINRMVDAIGPKAQGIAETGFAQTFEAMNTAQLAVGLDSGLTHLCTAFGIPTLVIMGPTTETDGFWPHASATVSLPLYCRPCSRFGGPVCPIGDHYCMERLSVPRVFNHLNSLRT